MLAAFVFYILSIFVAFTDLHAMESQYCEQLKQGLRLISKHVRKAQEDQDNNQEQRLRETLFIIRFYGIQADKIELYLQATKNADIAVLLSTLKDFYISPAEADKIINGDGIKYGVETLLNQKFKEACECISEQVKFAVQEGLEYAEKLCATIEYICQCFDLPIQDKTAIIKAVNNQDWQTVIDVCNK